MKPCAKRVTSASGAKWIRRAETLARSIKAASGVRRNVVDGYIIEGRRTGKNLQATVLDPQGTIVCDAFMDVGGPMRRAPLVGFKIARDSLSSSIRRTLPSLTSDRGATAVLTPFIADQEPRRPLDIQLRESTGWNAVLMAGPDPFRCTRFSIRDSPHAPVELSDGYMAYGYTAFQHVTTHPVGDGAGQLTRGSFDLWRAREREKTNAAFAFGVVHREFTGLEMSLEDILDAEFVRTAQYPGPEGLGLIIDARWIERHIGGGVSLSYEDIRKPGDSIRQPLPETGAFASLTDTWDMRYTIPWAVGLVQSYSSDAVVWRVLTRYCTPRQFNEETQTLWSLCWFDVTVTRDDEGMPFATVGAVTSFSATSMPDPLDRAWRYADGYPGSIIAVPDPDDRNGWAPHAFGAPTVGAGATALIPYMVLGEPSEAELLEYEEYYAEAPGLPPTRTCRYSVIRLTPDGEFDVVSYPRRLRRGFQFFTGAINSAVGGRWIGFFGGARVGSSGVYLNPIEEAGNIVLNADTGELQVYPRSFSETMVPNGVLNFGHPSNVATESLMRNCVCWYGERMLAFPMTLSLGNTATNYQLGTIDIDTGEVVVRGQFMSPQETGVRRLTPILYNLTKPHMVQRYIAPDETTGDEGEPGVIIWGANAIPSSRNAGFGSSTLFGRLKVSLDGGQTWTELMRSGRLYRAAWYCGSSIHRPDFGELWRPK